ncbi:sulfurtransferase complex subunit TusB [Marinobacter sp. C2H3]|uniref:sulfurtransferase complex subunit TusB n=1 Tax=Marinobacter sp. C2H3 TaxID=3119003 RepID=UPI00300EFE71
MATLNTLHIVNRTPDQARFQHCLAALADGDALLLTENAVLALAGNHLAGVTVPVYALVADAAARSLEPGAEQGIDYAGMVSLSARAKRVISW